MSAFFHDAGTIHSSNDLLKNARRRGASSFASVDITYTGTPSGPGDFLLSPAIIGF